MEFLPTKYVLDYVENNPKPLTELGEFVYYRTYSRWLPERGRREYWHETVKRAIEYNLALEYSHLRDIGFKPKIKKMRDEAKELFNSIYETKQFPSGRTLWIGNANEEVNKNFTLGNFNCSFTNVEKWEDLGEIFYLLLVGTGVGIKSTKKMASRMPKIRTNTTLLHSEYEPVEPEHRLEHSKTTILKNGFAKIYVGDSKEGWKEALDQYTELLTKPEHEDIHSIKLSYNSVRPKGERLKTFGGTASGHDPLKEMFVGIDEVLKNKIDPNLDPIITGDKGYGQVRPIHILDISNLIGNNVVVGGVRRTAEIFLMDDDDYETMFAKYGINGIWDEEQHNKVVEATKTLGLKSITKMLESIELFNPNARPLHHRRMSNNSVAFEKKPSRNMLRLLFEMMKAEGEPGFINMEEAKRRRPNAEGTNPCAEILLDSKQVCNLTTINVRAFVTEDKDGNYALDFDGLMDAQKLSTRIGLRMTLATLELPEWDKKQKRDHLVGTSLTGYQDALDMLGLDTKAEEELLNALRKVSRDEADNYAKELRIPSPLLATTVKPEGTLSQVAGGVSPGVHMNHAPYYIRRIRINSTDPLVEVAKELGWTIHADVGTEGHNDVKELAKPEVIEKAQTLVVDFPIKGGSDRSKIDVDVDEQFDTYFRFQEHYTEHNSSNTIEVKPHEWDQAEQRVWDGWDNFVGVSFLAQGGGSYALAPYEDITEEEYNKLKNSMKTFDPSILHKYEESETEADLDNMEECANGVCPIR